MTEYDPNPIVRAASIGWGGSSIEQCTEGTKLAGCHVSGYAKTPAELIEYAAEHGLVWPAEAPLINLRSIPQDERVSKYAIKGPMLGAHVPAGHVQRFAPGTTGARFEPITIDPADPLCDIGGLDLVAPDVQAAIAEAFGFEVLYPGAPGFVLPERSNADA